MYSFLLVIIYLSFISLGLPDSLWGSAWPVMYRQLNVPMSYAGIITMIIAGGTIVSSLMSNTLTKKIGAGAVTAASVFMTAAALFGFSSSSSFLMLCIWAVPYGLGSGAVDAALNNYVALYYAPRHMSWLHCFWGIGASVSPYIMSFCLIRGLGWQKGYFSVGTVQTILTAILVLSLPMWKKRSSVGTDEHTESKSLTLFGVLKIDGIIFILLTFFGYCALETTTGLWASSYLTNFRGVAPQISAQFASLFYIGITFGRFLCGFVSEKIGDKLLIRIGIITIIAGINMVALPFETNNTALAGLIIIGLGCAPVYPSIIHATPFNFGKENSQAIIGIQMACAYMGSTFMPPVFGMIARNISVGLYPVYLMIFALIMIIMSEKMNKKLNIR